MITQEEFLNALEFAVNTPSEYRNKFPYNLGYHYADGHYSYDCWNLDKVALTGKLGTNQVGTYIAPSVTGDVDGKTLLSRCTAQSKNFSKLCVPLTYLYLSTSPHSGIYIGDRIVNGKTVNVIECTKNRAWGVNGVCYSYVDASGRRFNYKGGKQSLAWTDHGLLTRYVKYTDIPSVGYSYEKFKADCCSILGVNTCEEAFKKAPKISTVLNCHNPLVTPLERYMRLLGYYGGKIEADVGDTPWYAKGMKDAIKGYQRDIVKPANPHHIDGVLDRQGATWKKLLLG